MGIRCADHATPTIPQKLALTSPTSSGRSVGIVYSRTKATEFSFFNHISYQRQCSWLPKTYISVTACEVDLQSVLAETETSPCSRMPYISAASQFVCSTCLKYPLWVHSQKDVRTMDPLVFFRSFFF
jgi:hypothetical protein